MGDDYLGVLFVSLFDSDQNTILENHDMIGDGVLAGPKAIEPYLLFVKIGFDEIVVLVISGLLLKGFAADMDNLLFGHAQCNFA